MDEVKRRELAKKEYDLSRSVDVIGNSLVILAGKQTVEVSKFLNHMRTPISNHKGGVSVALRMKDFVGRAERLREMTEMFQTACVALERFYEAEHGDEISKE